MQATKFSGDNAGLHVLIYPGDNKILIAMSLDDNSVNTKFRVVCTTTTGQWNVDCIDM